MNQKTSYISADTLSNFHSEAPNMANYINYDSSVSMRQSQCALLSRDV